MCAWEKTVGSFFPSGVVQNTTRSSFIVLSLKIKLALAKSEWKPRMSWY